MGKILSYKLLGTALKSLSDACFKADEQQRNGEKIKKWFPKINALDYERKIFDECISFLNNGGLPYHDLKV